MYEISNWFWIWVNFVINLDRIFINQFSNQNVQTIPNSIHSKLGKFSHEVSSNICNSWCKLFFDSNLWCRTEIETKVKETPKRTIITNVTKKFDSAGKMVYHEKTVETKSEATTQWHNGDIVGNMDDVWNCNIPYTSFDDNILVPNSEQTNLI